MDIIQKTKYFAPNAVILLQLFWAKTLAGVRFSNLLARQNLTKYELIKQVYVFKNLGGQARNKI